ncbi:MAG: exodeoxyribonuclease VII small subunit [Bacteroidetes bacterium QH_2_67_10]|nr:MAG: exodeoxyribonuclease VII small subunit [Bacteroidetes bacterium QH_2_67_10]
MQAEAPHGTLEWYFKGNRHPLPPAAHVFVSYRRLGARARIVPLEEALDAYEEGTTLARECMKRLNDAELRVERLSIDK